ncbi:MAG TPA: ABC transporter ATP-binding protein [Roseimicrobium sp.]|nr:ABC transporter ATP-binding protein [Roseimicrobium sp.]
MKSPLKRSKSPVLDVQKLRIERSGTVILKNFSWTVKAGEHWAVLGSNGSGKTSLLSALTGYLMPTEGDITLLGERYGESDWRELRKSIGIVSSSLRQMMGDTEPALDSIVSGKYAMIDFWGKPSVADRRQARKILRQIECEYLAERPWAYLSQGERQRILIGRALMAIPRLLILDEPCAGLDPAAREHFLQFIHRLGRQPGAPTLILVTHHVEEIMPVFTHALIIRKGGVQAAGRKTQVITSINLSQAFHAKVKVRRTAGRFSLAVSPTRRVVI